MAEGLPDKIIRAMKIVDGLGAYGMTYIEDPTAPFEAVFGKAGLIDTVRFPRTTLRVHSGDCDDTTALLASLLESASVHTAIMTTPGHVFLAFDTGESASSAWMFNVGGYRAISYSGSLWLPIETTVLSQGFASAWKIASQLVTKYQGTTQLEFIPTATAQDSYPAMPLSVASFNILQPAPESVTRFEVKSTSQLMSTLVSPAESELAKQSESEQGNAAVTASLKLGILRARFGRLNAAAEVFANLIRDVPGSLPAYLNLANVQVLMHDLPSAQDTLQRAESQVPESPSILFLLAQVARERSDRTAEAGYLARLAKVSPTLAARLGREAGGAASSSSLGTERAASEANVFDPVWSAGD